MLSVEETAIPAVKIVTPKKFGDHRGFFSETWSRKGFADAGLDLDFVQDNQSLSAPVGTLRGLHFPVSYTHLDVYKRQARKSVSATSVFSQTAGSGP